MRTTIRRLRRLPGSTANGCTMPLAGAAPSPLSGHAGPSLGSKVEASVDSAVTAQRRHHRRLMALGRKREDRGALTVGDARLLRMSGQILGIVNAAIYHARHVSPESLARLQDAVRTGTRRTA